MKPFLRHTRLVWGVLLSLALLSACTSGPGPIDEQPYIETILAVRADKDRFLRTSDDSPIPPASRAAFPPLPYYEIKPDFRLPSVLTERRGEAPVIIDMQTTGKEPDKMRRVGTLGFAIGAVEYTLTAFASPDDRTMERLFVPFGDLTNGLETYKGGRYMNLRRTATNLYDLDFNQAFHPYCVYNPTWVCPVPPRENRLAVAIPAGERLSPDHK
jgi:uncharacterized protein (DUF1684 family)